MPILLIGFMGAGKSSVGRILARLLGYRFIDLDARIDDSLGMRVMDIFKSHGEAYFRLKEAEALRAALKEENVVIACGGGLVMSAECQASILGLPYVVYLETDFASLEKRLKYDTKRPLWKDRARTMDLFNQRAPLYRALSTHRVKTDGKTPEEVALEVVGRVGLSRKDGNDPH
jgi:shikimate kinase